MRVQGELEAMADACGIQQHCIVHVLVPSVMSLPTRQYQRNILRWVFESKFTQFIHEFNDWQGEILRPS